MEIPRNKENAKSRKRERYEKLPKHTEGASKKRRVIREKKIADRRLRDAMLLTETDDLPPNKRRQYEKVLRDYVYSRTTNISHDDQVKEINPDELSEFNSDERMRQVADSMLDPSMTTLTKRPLYEKLQRFVYRISEGGQLVNHSTVGTAGKIIGLLPGTKQLDAKIEKIDCFISELRTILTQLEGAMNNLPPSTDGTFKCLFYERFNMLQEIRELESYKRELRYNRYN